MAIIGNLLFWLHLAALALAGAATFGLPVVGSKISTATPEARPLLFTIAGQLSTFARAALVTLIVTGPLLIWLKFGGMAGFTWWFSLKMALVLVLLVSVIFGGILLKRAKGGDRAAGGMLPRLGALNMVLLLGIILSAVFAFN